ncbi:MAG: enoyl-CoA hydratase/isomerase family protein [Roseinatronobacter sp.]
MPEVHIRKEGRAGRITLTRASALNALSYAMCLAIDKALLTWAGDDDVALVILDAEGEKAFCAGGDIAEMYNTGRAGDFGYGRRFWADEYRMNARLAEYEKPIVSFLHGFVMGGGVGLGCHVSHRVVCDTTQIAMPECAIGLIPDVGGTYLLARAPGHLGAYLGLTGARIGPGDAILTGFADHFLPHEQWDAAKAMLIASGDVLSLPHGKAPPAQLEQVRDLVDHAFAAKRVEEIDATLANMNTDLAKRSLKALRQNAPLSMACTLEVLRQPGTALSIRSALTQEYRFTWRSMEKADFLEGIRAAIIDKDRCPKWKHASVAEVSDAEVAGMLASLGADELDFDQTREESA